MFSVAPHFPQILSLAAHRSQGEPSRKELMSSKHLCYAVWKEPRGNVQRKQRPASCWLCMYSLALVMVSNIEHSGHQCGARKTMSGPVSDHHMYVHCCTLVHSCPHFLTLRRRRHSFQCGRMEPVLFYRVLWSWRWGPGLQTTLKGSRLRGIFTGDWKL